MKRWKIVFLGIWVLALPLTSFAATAPPDRDLNQQQPQEGVGGDEGKGGGSVTLGSLSGEVVGVDPQTGRIEIRTPEGKINRFNVEGDAKGQLSTLQKGDQVDLVMDLRAIEILPRTGEGASVQRAQPTLP
ncbi:MAG: hypothetical protein HY282_15905 [Nitrospirae bacterium]|nr:hypothetical protein [Candidatus Manganitrophaceae bacterium]